MTKKIIAIVVSILAITAIGCFVGLNWKSIKAMLSGAQIYTAEQMEESYNQGYADANTNEDTYLQQLDYYKNLVEDNELEIENLNNEITNLTNTNVSFQSQITNLNGIIEENESTIESLQSTISDNNTTISDLNTQISGLNSEIDSLENDIEDLQNELSQANEDYQILQAELTTKTNQVISLQNQVNNLQTLVNQLNVTNELNLSTISTLNSQIETLNSQISDLTYQINNNDSTVASLNNKITQLQESISYYENYISNLENETQVVVTFEFDGSVYNIQIVNKGATVSVVNPTSTDYVQFNYWTINKEQIDLSSYTFNTNTKVVADVTYSYDVTFYVDNAEHNTQIVEHGNKATTPTVPTKTGYTFLGWSLNGSDIVDLSTVTITENTNFYALFVQQFSVQFVYEDDVISTQTINNGAYATSPSVESTAYKVFNGWKVNGTSVNVETYKIVGATTFVADITYKYDVIFMVDNEEYNTQIVTSGQYATVPTAPTKDGYIFKGWSLTGSDIIDLSRNSITATTTYYAVFEVATGLFNQETGEMIYSWQELIDENIINVSGSSIREGSDTTRLAGLLKIDSNITEIYWRAFQNCKLLTGIEIPTSVSKIYSSNAFNGCTNLTYFNYLGTLEDYLTKLEFAVGSALSNPMYYTHSIYLNGTKLEGVINIPDGITTIPNYAFYSNWDITGIKFSDSVTKINTYAFSNCINLKDDLIEFSNNLTTIGSSAFSGCSSLTNLIVPESVVRIERNAFRNCTSLESIFIGSNITQMCPYEQNISTSANNYSAFYGCNENLKIYMAISELPSTSSSWKKEWNMYDSNENVLVVYTGYTLEQYLNEINSNN